VPVLHPLLAKPPAELDELAVAVAWKVDQTLERPLQLNAHAVQVEDGLEQLFLGALDRIARLLRACMVIAVGAVTLGRVLRHAQLLFEIRTQRRKLRNLSHDRANSRQLAVRLVHRVRAEPLHGSTILPQVDATAARQRFAEATVARLATVGADGRPHLAPITFALEDDTIYFAVDAKPKRAVELQRLKNIRANPAVCVLVDHYENDWTRLWWVRVDGTARIVEDRAEAERALDLLARRYVQYARTRPPGPVVAITVDRISGWSGA
jgi:PPOX class probable F420-dependent enzyme